MELIKELGIQLIVDIVLPFFEKNIYLSIFLIILVIVIPIIKKHFDLAKKFQESKNKIQDNSEIKKKKDFWVILTGLIPLILLFTLFGVMLFPSTNSKIQDWVSNCETGITETDTVETTEPTESDTAYPSPSLELFSDDCISSQWNVFNTESHLDEKGQCIVFDDVSLTGSLNNGFNIVHSGQTNTSFYIYHSINNHISEISFRFRVNKLTGYKINNYYSTDFYFGFIPQDSNLEFDSKNISSDKVEFDGDFIIISGYENIQGNVIMHVGENTYTYYDTPDDTLIINESYQVNIRIYGNTWNVEIVNTKDSNNRFVRKNIDRQGDYFTFGFRIPTNGLIELSVLDFSMQ